MRRTACRECVVSEHHAMSDEAIFPDLDQLAHHGMRLHASTIANDDTLLDFDKWTDKAIVADPALVEIDGIDDRHSGAERNVSDLRLADVRTIHTTVPAMLVETRALSHSMAHPSAVVMLCRL